MKIFFDYRRYIIKGFLKLLFFKNYVVQMMTYISDAHLKSFLKVFYHSHQHIVWDFSDFFAVGLFEIFQGMKTMFKNFSFEAPHQKKSQKLKSGER